MKIENGNYVIFDFAGFKDGVQFPGGTAKAYGLKIGSG
jgi:FKBP-type peptidyl-prolyl cis-trans isomerase (trigger factor)